MPKPSKSTLPFPNLRRVKQANNYYCGPAVIEMLYSFLGKDITQEEIVQVAGVASRIKKQGMRVDEMAVAVQNLTPEYQFWFKRQSKMGELAKIVNQHHFPVGVEWQGIFEYDGPREEDEDDDPGHYGVITKINLKSRQVYLADPFRIYAGKDRKFTLLRFERRWWDINEVVNQTTGKKKKMDDYHMMFVIVPKEEDFPRKLGMHLRAYHPDTSFL